MRAEEPVARVEDRRRARAPGHPGLQIVDPDPQRHPAVAAEELQVARLPGELRLSPAQPREARPAVRERPHQGRELRRLAPYPGLDVKPVVLGLHPRRRLHPAQRPHRRRPVAPPQVPHYGLVASLVGVVPAQELAHRPRLHRPALPGHPEAPQPLQDRSDRLLQPTHRGRLEPPAVHGRPGFPLPETVAEGPLGHAELPRHLTDRHLAVPDHLPGHHDLLLSQLRHRFPRRRWSTRSLLPTSAASIPMRKTGCLQTDRVRRLATRSYVMPDGVLAGENVARSYDGSSAQSLDCYVAAPGAWIFRDRVNQSTNVQRDGPLLLMRHRLSWASHPRWP